jgi:hypothetical protein
VNPGPSREKKYLNYFVWIYFFIIFVKELILNNNDMVQNEEKQIGDYLVRTYYDNYPDNPRNWDNLGTMVCFHKKLDLGDTTDYRSQDYDAWGDLRNDIEENEGEVTILPLYLYQHGGETIRTSPFGCQFDSGQVGFIYVSKDKIEKEGIDESRVIEYLENEVETYDKFLRGECFGYKVFKIKICSLGHKHEEEVESCFGYYDEDDCMTDGVGMVDFHLKRELV